MMSRWLLCVAFVIVGCVRNYEPPSAKQPHGIVKLRRAYERVVPTQLREVAAIDEHVAFSRTSLGAIANTARTDAILVHPVRGVFSIASKFFHYETRMVQEPYTVYESKIVSESYGCSSGFGTNKTYRTCTRSVSRMEPRTKYRWVNKDFEASDGACSQTLAFTPENGRVYLLQYTYQAPGACSLSCFERTAGAEGTFTNQPCPM
jgi:hypothetical protein